MRRPGLKFVLWSKDYNFVKHEKSRNEKSNSVYCYYCFFICLQSVYVPNVHEEGIEEQYRSAESIVFLEVSFYITKGYFVAAHYNEPFNHVA